MRRAISFAVMIPVYLLLYYGVNACSQLQKTIPPRDIGPNAMTTIARVCSLEPDMRRAIEAQINRAIAPSFIFITCLESTDEQTIL